MKTCKKCGTEFLTYATIDGKVRIFSSRKYCLACSPFKGRNTRNLEKLKDVPLGAKRCPRCQEIKAVDDFYRYSNGSSHGWCKKCLSSVTKKRQRMLKVQAIQYKGGKCLNCGQMPHPAAMAFHHRDRKEKDFSISSARSKSFKAIKTELDKCDLLCKNCHAIHHAQYDDWSEWVTGDLNPELSN